MVYGIFFVSTALPSTDSTPVPPLPKPSPSCVKSNTMVCLPGVSAGPSHRKRSAVSCTYVNTGLLFTRYRP